MARLLLCFLISCMFFGCAIIRREHKEGNAITASEQSEECTIAKTDRTEGRVIVVKEPSEQVPSKLWIWKNVDVAFGTGDWRLFFGASRVIGLPIEAFVHVYAKRGDRIESILSPQDMNKLDGISVTSNDEALNFVRLFTNRDFVIVFQSPLAIEHEPESTVVEKKNDGFYITRQLVYWEETKSGKHRLYRVKERVSFNGKYQVVEKQFLKYLSPTEARFPIFE